MTSETAIYLATNCVIQADIPETIKQEVIDALRKLQEELYIEELYIKVGGGDVAAEFGDEDEEEEE